MFHSHINIAPPSLVDCSKSTMTCKMSFYTSTVAEMSMSLLLRNDSAIILYKTLQVSCVLLYSPISLVSRTTSTTPDSGVTGLYSGWMRSTFTVVPFSVYRSDLESARIRQLPRRPARVNFFTISASNEIVRMTKGEDFKVSALHSQCTEGVYIFELHTRFILKIS